jgi:hypothetical protein
LNSAVTVAQVSQRCAGAVLGGFGHELLSHVKMVLSGCTKPYRVICLPGKNCKAAHSNRMDVSQFCNQCADFAALQESGRGTKRQSLRISEPGQFLEVELSRAVTTSRHGGSSAPEQTSPHLAKGRWL